MPLHLVVVLWKEWSSKLDLGFLFDRRHSSGFSSHLTWGVINDALVHWKNQRITQASVCCIYLYGLFRAKPAYLGQNHVEHKQPYQQHTLMPTKGWPITVSRSFWYNTRKLHSQNQIWHNLQIKTSSKLVISQFSSCFLYLRKQTSFTLVSKEKHICLKPRHTSIQTQFLHLQKLQSDYLYFVWVLYLHCWH